MNLSPDTNLLVAPTDRLHLSRQFHHLSSCSSSLPIVVFVLPGASATMFALVDRRCYGQHVSLVPTSLLGFHSRKFSVLLRRRGSSWFFRGRSLNEAVHVRLLPLFRAKRLPHSLCPLTCCVLKSLF